LDKDSKIKELSMIEKGYMKKEEELKQQLSQVETRRAKPKVSA
jgi:hypothetical protein